MVEECEAFLWYCNPSWVLRCGLLYCLILHSKIGPVTRGCTSSFCTAKRSTQETAQLSRTSLGSAGRFRRPFTKTCQVRSICHSVCRPRLPNNVTCKLVVLFVERWHATWTAAAHSVSLSPSHTGLSITFGDCFLVRHPQKCPVDHGSAVRPGWELYQRE